ncbi:MAG: hypothetical protein JSU91_06080 [Thermoplasmatales archaeon]|nr:MAG: hypothetical protein JSU91_06080 [Thermoplasmatales archaeon]
MRKKIMLGSVLITLLMLVTTQLVVLNIVRSSDPTAHAGDADVGDLWIDELDVSQELITMDYIGISHVNATDDWVFWTDGTGNINASWDVDIAAGDHPEYYIVYTLEVFNIDDNCSEIGNDTFLKTYTSGFGYDESGTLSVAIEFTQQQQQAGSQTLVCILGAYVRINDTIEVVNFTFIAQDRCIVGVDFTDPGDQPLFPIYREEANNNFPSMWSWIKGWADNSRFTSEDDMLNTQTFIKTGMDCTHTDGTYGNPDWDLGNITVRLQKTRGKAWFSIDDVAVNWKKNEGSSWLQGRTYINWSINDPPPEGHSPVLFRYTLDYEPHHEDGESATTFWGPNNIWFDLQDTEGEVDDEISVKDLDSDDEVSIAGDIWVVSKGLYFHRNLVGYTINIVSGTVTSSPGEQIEYFWEESCAYQNDSYAVSVTNSTSNGITTIDADISNVLTANNEEFVYTFAADRGDTRITVSC